MTPLDPTAAPKASPAPLLKPPQSGAGLGNLTQLLAAQLQQEQQSAPAAARRPAVQASQAELGTKLAQSAPNAATGARRPVSGSSWSFAGQAASGKGKEIPRSLNEALTVVGQNASMFDEYDEERRPDGSVSMQDLEAIAADESLPQHVRVAAALLYDSEDQAKSQFYGEPGTFDLQEVQAFSEASATLQTVLLRERNLSAAKLSPAELAAVNEQLVAQSQDPNAVRLVKNGDALLQQLNEPYLQTLTSVAGGVEARARR